MLYRGGDLRLLNDGALDDGRIASNDFPVVYADPPPNPDRQNRFAQAISTVEEYITRRETVSVAGGVTSTLPAAIKFTKNVGPPGVVLHLDESVVGPQVTGIEYTLEWFDNHPGVLAHTDTLSDGEYRVDGEILSMLDVQDDKTVFHQYGRDRVESRATSPTYQDEMEMVSTDGPIDVSGAITAIAVYLGTEGTSGYTIRNNLKSLSAFDARFGSIKDAETGEVVAGSDDYRAQAEVLYEELPDLLASTPAPLYLVAVDSRNDIQADDGRITPENFRFVYNGRGFDTDYGRNSSLLGGI